MSHARRLGVISAALVVAGAAGTSLASPASAGSYLGLWLMNESPGATTMADASGLRNHGRLSNVVAGQPGQYSTSYRFNGTQSKVTVPSSPSLNPGNLSLTLNASLLVPSTLPLGDYNVIQKGTSVTPGGHYKLEIRANNTTALGQPRCTFRGSTGRVIVASRKNIADGRWHRISCKKTATSVSIIVDGVTTTKAGVVGSISNTVPLTMGYKPTTAGTAFFRGGLDAVSLTR